MRILNRDASNPTGWKPVGKIHLLDALRKIARREWTPVWFDDGELVGVHPAAPPRQGSVVMRCGSAECQRWWVETAQARLIPRPQPVKVAKPFFREVLIDFFERGVPVKKVSAELALKRIDLGQWVPIWDSSERRRLIGVAAGLLG